MSYRLAACLFLFCLVATLGCGGAEGSGEEFPLIEFEGDDPAVVGAAAAVGAGAASEVVHRGLSLRPEAMEEVAFLYQVQVRFETVQRLNRELESLLDEADSGSVGLEWVIDVHRTTEETDAYFRLLTGLAVPEPLREQYGDLFLGMLDAVQVSAAGLDRLLAAALKVGPGGRTLAVMNQAELDEFEGLVRESRFYVNDADGLLDDRLKDLGKLVGRLRLR